jgi:hypothetical protein
MAHQWLEHLVGSKSYRDQWIYGSETPRYDFSYQLSDAADGKTELTMSLTQSDVSESFRMMLPLYAVIDGKQLLLQPILR